MSESSEELPMQSIRLCVQVTPRAAMKDTSSESTVVLYLLTASGIFVSDVSLFVGLQPWRLLEFVPPDGEDIGDADNGDDTGVDSRLTAVIHPPRSVDDEESVCQTVACENEGSSLYRQLEFHQDPREDFYAYVCRRWEMNNMLPSDAAKVSVDDSLVDDCELFLAGATQKGRPGYEAIRDVYLTCEYPRLGDTRMLETLAEIGLHPLPVILKDGLTFDEILNDLMALGIQPFYSLSAKREFQNPELSFLHVEEPHLLMGPLRHGLDVEYAYLDDALSLFVRLVADRYQTLCGSVLKMERPLSSFMDRHLEQGLGSQDEIFDVTEQFSELSSNWLCCFPDNRGESCETTDQVCVTKISASSREQNYQVYQKNLLSYVAFRAHVELSEVNDRDKENLMDLAFSRYVGYRSSSPVSRHRYCVRLPNKYEPSLLMHMTMDATANKLGGKASLNSLLNLLETMFNETISYQTSSVPNFRKSLIQYLSAINWEALVPDAVVSHNEIFRRRVSICETADGSNRVIEGFMSLATMLRFRDNEQKNLDNWIGWSGGMLSSYARLDSPFLKLEIPLPVFDFSRTADAFLERFRIPRIGARIFYAMYHGVYHLAYNYGAGKRPAPFVSRLHALMDCLERHYGKLRRKRFRSRISPYSYYSNLLDFLALEPTFQAYLHYAEKTKKNERLPKLENVSPQQLLFVEYARSFCEVNNSTYLNRVLEDGHVSPGWYRVNGPLMNFKPFADAFMCTPNTFMNPLHRCSLL